MTGPAPSRPQLLTHSQARGLAESIWGPGGTTACRANRTGAFYFSCSGHGGFVIDDRALTGQERERLAAAGFTADSCWGVRDATGRIVTVRHRDSQVLRPRRVTYQPGRGERVDASIPVWIFEEDCDWAAVYVFTGIRTPGAWNGRTESQIIGAARECLARWYPQAAKTAAGLSRGAGAPVRAAAVLPSRSSRLTRGIGTAGGIEPEISLTLRPPR